MAEAEGKKGDAQRGTALAALIARAAPSLRILVPLALGMLLLFLGAFLVWQSILIWRVDRGSEEADGVRAIAINSIAAHIAQSEQAAQKALDDAGVQQALRTEGAVARGGAAARLKQLLPNVTDVAFFSPNLDEVLSGDLKQIGYAKAAALMQAKLHPEHPPAEMRIEPEAGQQLMLALPATVDGKVVAFAVVELPFAPTLQKFTTVQIAGARLVRSRVLATPA